MSVKTPEGTIESGPANQRHFVRAVDGDVEGVRVVCSFPHNEAYLALDEKTALSKLYDLTEKYGGEIELRDEKGGLYPTEAIALKINW